MMTTPSRELANTSCRRGGQETTTISGHVLRTGKGKNSKNLQRMAMAGVQKQKNEEEKKPESTAYTYHRDLGALGKIQHFQRRTELLIRRKLPFAWLVREITQEVLDELRIKNHFEKPYRAW